jgi:hypothetical protein
MPSRKDISMELRAYLQKLGRKGGKSRAKALSPQRRSAIARKAAAASAKVRSAKAKGRKLRSKGN